jgi:hypothetical protein
VGIDCLDRSVLSLEKRTKAGLYEVMIACQRIRDAAIGHNDERSAVGERPILVASGKVQASRPIKDGLADRHDLDARIAAEHPMHSLEHGAIGRIAQKVAEFQHDEAAGEKAVALGLRFRRLLMRRLAIVDQRQKEESVGEKDVHGVHIPRRCRR